MSAQSPIDALSVWSTPLFQATLPDHEFLKPELLDAIYEQKAAQKAVIESQVAPGAKHALHESSLEFLECDNPTVMEVKRALEEVTLEVVSSLNEEHWPSGVVAHTHIIESWYHVTTFGGYHDAHSHPNCSWCGIYFVEPGDAADSQHGGLNRFYDPRVNAEHFADPATAYLGQQGFWDFTPQEGQVIIFPSYLKHSALPYFGKKDRVVIAFNSITELY